MNKYKKDTMTKTLCTVALFVVLAPLALPQDRTPPSVAMRDNDQLVSTRPGTERATKKGPYRLPFCHPKNCLYYAGDFDSTSSDANGLFNSNDQGGGLDGQVWVGVKPDRDVIVTGATFNEWFVVAGVGADPTPFVVQVGTKLGQAGKTICNTSGTATEAVYGESDGGPTQYSYTIKKLSKSCKLKKGKTYYVNLLPTFEDNYGYVVNVEDANPKNHYGWKNDINHCFFNGAAFGDNYVTCNSQGIGTNGFSEFSIALTGNETK
jgi:hypothetical protein